LLTGFNTDVEYDGVVYHVQTEDKGLQTPFILSLVYTGGAILASKRSPYDDLVAGGFDEGVLAERLSRQHKLICAAVHAGRIEDLRLLGERDANEKTAQRQQAAAAKLLEESDSERSTEVIHYLRTSLGPNFPIIAVGGSENPSISRPGSFANAAAREALTSGRTFIGTNRRLRRWDIANALVHSLC